MKMRKMTGKRLKLFALLLLFGYFAVTFARAWVGHPVHRPPDALRFIAFLSSRALRSPILVHDDRLLFLQGDMTLTLLDLRSGEVLHRDVQARDQKWDTDYFLAEDRVFHWRVVGRIAYGISRSAVIFVNTETGESTISPMGRYWSYASPVVYKTNLFVLKKETEQLVLLNSVTLEEKAVAHNIGPGDTFTIVGDRLLVSGIWPRHRAITCFDASTGELVWHKGPDASHTWKGIACDESRIYVFSLSDAGETRIKETDRKEWTETGVQSIDTIFVFDANGDLLAEEAANLEDFGKRWPSTFHEVTFRGVDYRYSRPSGREPDWRENRHIDDERGNRAEEILGRRATGTFFFPNDSDIVGVDFFSGEYAPRWNGPDGFGLYFKGTNLTWQSWLAGLNGDFTNFNTLRRKNPYWHVFQNRLYQYAVTDEFIIVSTPDARVECFDRGTGRSVWLYKYAGFNQERWSGIATEPSAGPGDAEYYVDAYARFQKELSPAAHNGSAVLGDTQPPATRVVLDPIPLPFPEMGITKILAWGISIVCLGLLLFRSRPQSPAAIEDTTNRTYAALFLAFVGYAFFGHYAHPPTILMQLAILLSFGLLFRYKYRSLKPPTATTESTKTSP